MSEKLTQDVQDIVDSIFKQKEEVAMRRETEDALNKSANKINTLVVSLEAKDGELSEMVTKAEELESKIAELSEKVSGLETEKKDLEKEKSDFEATKDELVKRAETAEEEVGNIKKDQLVKSRFDDLKEAGIAAIDEKAIEDQISKIRDMEEEVFESYKAERVELRKSIVAELEASAGDDPDADATLKSEEEVAAAKLKAEAEAAAKLKADEDDAVDSDDPIEPMKAVAAALNLETLPSGDVISKYHDLGKEMAKKFERKSE